ncbi:MAG: flavin prenyltransferase [Clostridiales bacterium]|nr:flavin prenyltransferase [Clostridiales bacterium]
MNQNLKRYIVAITGASGAILGHRLMEELLNRKYIVDLIITRAGNRVLKDELGITEIKSREGLNIYDIDNIGASIASGSVKTHGMIIVPCSMGTLGSIANGISSNLLHRAADVIIKEKRKLILVPREAPLSTIHLKNMLHVAQTGAVIIPPVPAFYTNPSTIMDVVDFVIGKVLDQLDIEHDLYTPYYEKMQH